MMGIFKYIVEWLSGIFNRPEMAPHDHLGWMADCPDCRDYEFSEAFPVGDPSGSADLTPHMPPVVDQGLLGTCVPCALAAMVSYLVSRERLEEQARRGMLVPLDPDPPDRLGGYLVGPDGGLYWDSRPAEPEASREWTATMCAEAFSRLFVYYEGRRLEGTTDEDSGMMLRSGLKALADAGVCLEGTWPYRTGRYAWKPSGAAYEQAERFRIRDYWRVTDAREAKACLDDGYPVAMGFMTYRGTWDAAGETGFMDVPAGEDRPASGHCVVLAGYDDADGTFLCRNSMGKGWGAGGYFRIPQRMLQAKGVVSDLWTIRPRPGKGDA